MENLYPVFSENGAEPVFVYSYVCDSATFLRAAQTIKLPMYNWNPGLYTIHNYVRIYIQGICVLRMDVREQKKIAIC